jgi:hypothetical protein
MEQIVQTDDHIEFSERMSAGLRVFLFIVGLFPWLAPYELLIKPGWSGFSIFTLFLLVISLGAVAVSLAFIGGAIFGLNQTLTFDRSSRSITHAYESTLVPLRVKKYSFAQLKDIEIAEHDWDSGPSTYGLKFTFSDGHHTEPGSLSSREEARQWQERIEGWLGPAR